MSDDKIPTGTGANRPPTARMPRQEFLAEFGDAVVDSNTMDELEDLQRRSGEPDELPSLEAIVNGQAEKPKPQEREAFKLEGTDQIDPAALPPTSDTQPPEEAFTLEERYKILEAQTQAQLAEYKREIEKLQASPTQQRQVPEPLAQEPDYMAVTQDQLVELEKYDPFTAQLIQQQQKSYKLEKQVQALSQRDTQREQQFIGQKFDSEVASVRSKYPDFETHMATAAKELNMSTQQLMYTAREMSVRSGNSQANFAKWAEDVYFQQLGKAVHAEKSKSQDELNKRREDKRQESIKAVSGVASGGSTYQPPQNVSKDKSMRGGREEMLAELRAMGLGR